MPVPGSGMKEANRGADSSRGRAGSETFLFFQYGNDSTDDESGFHSHRGGQHRPDHSLPRGAFLESLRAFGVRRVFAGEGLQDHEEGFEDARRGGGIWSPSGFPRRARTPCAGLWSAFRASRTGWSSPLRGPSMPRSSRFGRPRSRSRRPCAGRKPLSPLSMPMSLPQMLSQPILHPDIFPKNGCVRRRRPNPGRGCVTPRPISR